MSENVPPQGPTEPQPSDPVTAYAQDVVAGRIVAGPYVRAACQRHLDDLAKGAERGLWFDVEAAAAVVRFCRALTIEIEDGKEDDGQVRSRVAPFELQPWQVFIVGSLMGWKNAKGLRRFRRAYIEAAKGSGKTPMSSAVGLYFLAGRGVSKERGQIFSAATSRDQATILFRDAVAMWKRSPGLRKRLTTKGKQTQTISQLTHIRTDGFFRPVSAENKGQSGLRPYCALIDEVHEHPDNVVIEMMRAGTKGNQEALILEITNSGFDKKTVCGQEHDYSLKVVSGEEHNDAWFAYVCALDIDSTETFDIDAAVDRMAHCCSCSANTTLTKKPEPSTAFALAVTSALDALGISSAGYLAPTTLIEWFLRAVSVTPATSDGSTASIPTTATNGAPSPTNGGARTEIVQGAPDERGPSESELKTQSFSWRKPAAESMASPRNSAGHLRNGRGTAARFAELKPICALITATLLEHLADSSAINATLESVCSAITSMLYEGHSITCPVRQRYTFSNGRLAQKIQADDPFEDESCWIKANPNLGISIHPAYIREQVVEAKGMPSKEGTVRRLNFCQWTESDTSAIPRGTWTACEGQVDPDVLTDAGYQCFGGLDLSRTRDLTAFTLTWVLEKKKDEWRFASKTWFWTPKDTLRERAKIDRAPYEEWVRQKFMEAVPGQRVAHPWIADALGELCNKYSPVSIGCDQYGLEQLTDHLDNAGIVLPCVVHPQGFNRRVIDKKAEKLGTGADEVALWMPDSINKLEAALLEKRITIDKNPVMAMCAAGVVYTQNRTGARMFDKSKATRRIDGMVSLAMSIGVATIVLPDPSAALDEFLASANAGMR